MDLKLESRDLDTTNAQLSLVSGTEAIAQHIGIRLRTFLGEWLLDEKVGIPYFTDILVKNPNPAILQKIFRDCIAETPGVLSIEDYEIDLDAATRELSITAKIKTEGDGFLFFEYEDFILDISEEETAGE